VALATKYFKKYVIFLDLQFPAADPEDRVWLAEALGRHDDEGMEKSIVSSVLLCGNRQQRVLNDV
jgi:hypothetical protein